MKFLELKKSIYSCKSAITDVGNITRVFIDPNAWADGVCIETEDGIKLESDNEKCTHRTYGFICVVYNSKDMFCIDPRFIRLCVIHLWMIRSKKVIKTLSKNFPEFNKLPEYGNEFTKEDFINEIFVREANKEQITYEEAQRWCDVNLIKFDPMGKLLADSRREKYICDFGTLIEEPKGWYFGK